VIILFFKQGPQQGLRFELSQDRITFGRDPSSDVVISDPRASWEHFIIERAGTGYVVVDAGSRNGTYIGDDLTPVTVPEPLGWKSSIWFGDTELVVQIDQHAQSSPARAPKVSVDKTSEMDPSAALAMLEEIRRRQEAGEASPRARAAARANPAEIWEGVRDESVVVDEHLNDDDFASFPESFRLRARLVFLAGPHEGRQVYLGSRPTGLGRDAEQDVILDDDLCSRAHARVERTDAGAYTLEDLGSRNGVMLNGRRIEKKRVLQHRSLITIGQSVIEFRAALIDEKTENPLKTVAMSLPLYSFQDKVLTQYELTIGRDPTSELFLEDRSVDRHHATLAWRGDAFWVRDNSARGTYVNGERVVERALQDGDALTIGIYRLATRCEGLRCSIDILQTRPDETEAFVNDSSTRKPYRTLIRLEIPEELRNPQAHNSAERVNPLKFKRKEVRWVPPMETLPSWRLPLMLATGVLAVAALLGLFALTGGGAFLSRPLSTAHDSQVFAQVASASDAGANCTACHLPFQGVADSGCNDCHKRDLSAAHASVTLPDSQEKLGCTDCHGEHKDREVLLTEMGQRCQSCHEDRHEALKAVTPGPLKLEAPGFAKINKKSKEKDFRVSYTASFLHEKHQDIERRCAGCHANADLTAEVDARTACLRCHGDQEQLAGADCAGCHNSEHGDSGDWVAAAIGHDPSADERQDRVFGDGGLLSALGGGVGYALLLFVPLGLVLGAHSTLRRRRLPAEHLDARPDKPRDLNGDGKIEAETATHDWEDVWELEIDAEKCVGAGPCIHACPYNVLEFDKKLYQAVAKYISACHGCRACAKACPQNAIIVYKASNGIPSESFPDVDPNYEVVDVPGLFLIGQVTGFKALMKNAVNLGHRTVRYLQHQGLKPGDARKKGFDVEIFIAGAGPGGISAGIECVRQGLSYALSEKTSDIANTHTNLMHKGKPLQANPSSVRTVGALEMFEGFKTREEVLDQWHRAVRDAGLQIRFDDEVKDIKVDGEGFVVTTSKGTVRALRVLLAIGSQGNPRKPGVPGEDLPKVMFSLRDPEEHNNQDLMVVGAGNSGLEIAIALATAHNGSNRVGLSIRQGLADANASAENKAKIQALVDAGRLTLHDYTNLAEIREGEVHLTDKEKNLRVVPNHYIFCALGALPPKKWLEQIGVKYVKKPANWNPGPTDDLGFLNTPRG
jgi:pSer/pThr/pTyr-binding forkhead associated (FHA) protein/thioredoxin reductase/NAD-dependent dihydropyrimidine dehydrogenase PreA subunit